MKNDCIDFLGNNGLFFQVRSEPMSIKYGCQLEKKDYHIGYNGFNVQWQFCIVDQLEQKQTDLFMSNITYKMHSTIIYVSYLSECKEQSNSSGRIEGVVNLFCHHIFAWNTATRFRSAFSSTSGFVNSFKSATVQFFLNTLAFISGGFIPSLKRFLCQSFAAQIRTIGNRKYEM